ncbi:hypothetical protein AAMO2058_001666100 [Amorphochlora amoebiformis]|eukprot:1380607-Amorphochlora_amoeboformis.AAC.1
MLRRKHFRKRTQEPDFSWTLFLIAALQVSVWSFGVWEHPFQQFLVTFQNGVKGERPNAHLSWEKPLPSLTQQLVELLILRNTFHSSTLKSAESAYLSKRTPKLENRLSSLSAKELQRTSLLGEESESEDGKAASISI